MVIKNALLGLGMALTAVLLPAALASANTYDILELPAAPTKMADKAPIFAIKKFGDRYFAVGDRGHIIYSDDVGKTWTQAEHVPVRSTLLDIDFAPDNELEGWAVGHEGVILHTSDGGKTWELQYDGLRYGEEGLAYYTKLAEENPDNELYDFMIGEMEFAISQGADKPFFRVNAHNDKFVHAAGAYGMLMATFDGGKTWVHRLESAENENFNHYFDFSPLPEPGKFFMSGEAGLFLIGDVRDYDIANRNARRVHSVPWEGSFFASVDAADGAIVLGGLRGRMFRTNDEGQTWTVVEKPPTSAIVSELRLQDGTLVATGVAGEFLVSKDNGQSFTLDPASGTVGPVFDIAEGDDHSLLVAGPKGIKTVTLAK
ncbi:MAG: hypothetical protein KDI21_12850 [Halieaceae bacterium]|nr:hypothetical protein [Halioglobus sp.]MCB1731357.1 hypothetical protein [Halieaceae bacterium]